MFDIDTEIVPARPTMTDLTAVLADVLALADHLGLPHPCYTTIHESAMIGLQFPPVRASLDAIPLWASTYCAAMRSDTHDGDSGPAIWASTEFELDGVHIDCYAHIPVSVTGPASTDQHDEPETVLPF